MFLKWYRKIIANKVAKCMENMNICLDQKDLILYTICSEYPIETKNHCATDCTHSECMLYKHYHK